MMMRVALLVLAFSGSSIGQELIEGKTFEHFAGVSIQLENRQNVTIRRCFFNDAGVAVRLKNCRNVAIESCAMTDLTIQGIDVRDGCSDIHLRETTGIIKTNLIVGVDETIHIPRSLVETVIIE